jgi:hypothetical protein
MKETSGLPARREVGGVVLAAALLSLSCSGPGGPRAHPVLGKVLYNGRPAAGARVVFHPRNNPDRQAARPYGIVGADGSFSLTTNTPGDGAPAGEYDVTVIWPTQSGRKAVGGALANSDRLKGAYSSPAQTTLHARVIEGKNELPAFDLR